MIFIETPLSGAFIIDVELLRDDRGFFARTFCQRDFAAQGLNTTIAQSNLSFNHHKGSLRGLHFQYPPAAETKLVRCIKGTMFDVIVDLRPESPTYLQHVSVELSAENRRSLYVPQRFAHGYQVLEDNTEVMYEVGAFYAPQSEGGLPYGDPRLGIAWPLEVTEISAKDRAWLPLDSVEADVRQRMTAPVPAAAR